MPVFSLATGVTGPCSIVLTQSSRKREKMETRLSSLAVVCFAALSSWLVASTASAQASVPERAQLHRHYLREWAYRVWGPTAPLPLFAAQIHQESGWKPDAKSAYACGLTQFTPDTAKWIAEQYKVDVGAGNCYGPRWAIRAMIRYDLHLYQSVGGKADCDKVQFMLSAYNGGLGWVQRDKKKAAAAGKDPNSYAAVAPFNAGRAPQFFAENRDYPHKIAVIHQPKYQQWGGRIACQELLNVK